MARVWGGRAGLDPAVWPAWVVEHWARAVRRQPWHRRAGYALLRTVPGAWAGGLLAGGLLTVVTALLVAAVVA
jgi:hypothetical protein